MKKRLHLILLVLSGLIVRTILAFRGYAHSDEFIINSRAVDIISAGRISTIDQMPLFHWFLDLMYNIFGISIFSARLGSIVFGSLLCVLVYLISRKFFSNRVSLFSAYLCAFSPYLLRYQAESNTTMTFFFLLSVYMFLEALDDGNYSYLCVAFLFAGIATLIKTIGLMLIPAFIVIWIVRRKEMPIKGMIYGGGFYSILLTPIISYNLILYSQKQYLDMLFVRYFTVPVNPYSDLLHGGGFSVMKGLIHIKEFVSSLVFIDPVILVLGGLGVFWYLYHFKKKKYAGLWQILIFLTIVSLFLFASSSMPKHYITTMTLVCLFAGLGLEVALGFVPKGFREKVAVGILGIFIVFSMFLISDQFEKHPGVSLGEFSSLMPKPSIVVADARIYRGTFTFGLIELDIVSPPQQFLLRQKHLPSCQEIYSL